MCGIFCYIGNTISLDVITGEFLKMIHRGPDCSSVNEITVPGFDSKILLGFHRLKIVDLSNNGNQPFKFTSNKKI